MIGLAIFAASWVIGLTFRFVTATEPVHIYPVNNGNDVVAVGCQKVPIMAHTKDIQPFIPVIITETKGAIVRGKSVESTCSKMEVLNNQIKETQNENAQSFYFNDSCYDAVLTCVRIAEARKQE